MASSEEQVEGSLPRWFEAGIDEMRSSKLFEDSQAVSGLLSAVLREMHGSFATFQSHIRNSASIIFGLITVAGIVFTFTLKETTAADPLGLS